MIFPNKSLVESQRRFCPEIPLDSPIVVYKFLEKLSKKNKERKENVEQN